MLSSARPVRPRIIIGIGILLVQVVQIGVARVHPMRYYCWAPFDSQNEYEVNVTIGGVQLSPTQVSHRYRIAQASVNPRAIYEVLSLITYVESRYRRDANTSVEVRYRTNGGPEQTWQWPLR